MPPVANFLLFLCWFPCMCGGKRCTVDSHVHLPKIPALQRRKSCRAEMLVVIQQCALVAKKVDGTLGCFRKGMASRKGRASSGLVRAHLECCLQYERDMSILNVVHQRVKKRFKGLEHHFYDERLRDLGTFILEKTRQKREKRITLEEADFSGLLIKCTDSGCETVSPVMTVSLCYTAENMYTI